MKTLLSDWWIWLIALFSLLAIICGVCGFTGICIEQSRQVFIEKTGEYIEFWDYFWLKPKVVYPQKVEE